MCNKNIFFFIAVNFILPTYSAEEQKPFLDVDYSRLDRRCENIMTCVGGIGCLTLTTLMIVSFIRFEPTKVLKINNCGSCSSIEKLICTLKEGEDILPIIHQACPNTTYEISNGPFITSKLLPCDSLENSMREVNETCHKPKPIFKKLDMKKQFVRQKEHNKYNRSAVLMRGLKARNR